MKTIVVNCRFENYDFYIGRPSKYKSWLLLQPKLIEDMKILKGKRLGCFCKPLSCHGDIIVSILESI